MREARIAMRTIDAAWTGAEIANDDLKRMAEAAERIGNRSRQRQAERVAAVAWLEAKGRKWG
jgi:hypothetical protein